MESSKLESLSPYELADKLYNKKPQQPGSLRMLPCYDDMYDDEVSLLFEMLITIYMEGIIDGHKLYQILTTKEDPQANIGLQSINVYEIINEQLLLCAPWFSSLGYILFVNEYRADEYVFDGGEYCKIILKDNPQDKNYFTSNNIDKSYHFILYRNYNVTDNIEDIKAIFHRPKNPNDLNDYNKIYTIKFKPLRIEERCRY